MIAPAFDCPTMRVVARAGGLTITSRWTDDEKELRLMAVELKEKWHESEGWKYEYQKKEEE